MTSPALVGDAPAQAWTGLFAVIALLLAADLALFRRRGPAAGLGANLAAFAAWVAVALGFGAWLWARQGPASGQQYIAGYLLELSLSVDNLFIFVLVFGQFRIEPARQHRVLFWGILGAVGLRTAFILAGVGVVARFRWLIPIFGAVIVLTGARLGASSLARPPPRGAKPGANHGAIDRMMGWVTRRIPVAEETRGSRFFVRVQGRRLATPLFAALLVIEAADLLFALDSIPAVLAVTRHAFIATASNVFAILGLRSLYLVVSGAIGRLRYMKIGLALLLILVGAKMLAARWVHVSDPVLLGVIAGVLAAAVGASLLAPRRTEPA
jgi:tellurite resistance protein TerC